MKIFELLGKWRGTKGSLSAFVNEKIFLESSYCLLHDAGTDFIITAGDGHGNEAAFSVPTKLEENRPHQVKLYTEGLRWDVWINGDVHVVDSGFVTITFDFNYRRAVGDIDFKLKDGRSVTGKFNLQNPGPV
jgi:hypothetical protein